VTRLLTTTCENNFKH